MPDGIRKVRKRSEYLEKFGQENIEPGDNRQYLKNALASWDLPPCNLNDPQEVEKRILEYFAFCMEKDVKPSMIGVANWVGVHRSTLNDWKRGRYRDEPYQKLMEKTTNLLENIWVDYMRNGKINPASGIFLGKNMFGYRDVIDIAPTQVDPLGEEQDLKAIEARIEGSLAEEDE